jgi:uncharacterized protein with ATP-grasp and redox domains
MRTHLECIPCFLKQSLEAARMATDDENIHTEVLNEVLHFLQHINFTYSPPALSRDVHQIIKQITKSKDPYKTVKNKSNDMAKKQYPTLKNMVSSSEDPLLMAIKLAIIGNVIDFGTTNRLDIHDMIHQTDKNELDSDAYTKFKKKLNQSHTILYLADNTGEIFFDKLLLEELVKLQKQITYVVKANPIINDATKKDAYYAGIDKLATILEGDSGQTQSAPGMILSYASEKFLDLFKSSDLVIAKGQGNYEGLNNTHREVFFMLVVKCPLVAWDMNREVGNIILREKE